MLDEDGEDNCPTRRVVAVLGDSESLQVEVEVLRDDEVLLQQYNITDSDPDNISQVSSFDLPH